MCNDIFAPRETTFLFPESIHASKSFKNKLDICRVKCQHVDIICCGDRSSSPSGDILARKVIAPSLPRLISSIRLA